MKLQDIFKDFCENEKSNSTKLVYKNSGYHTDIGYAFDGIYMILDIFEKELNCKIMTDDFRKQWEHCEMNEEDVELYKDFLV